MSDMSELTSVCSAWAFAEIAVERERGAVEIVEAGGADGQNNAREDAEQNAQDEPPSTRGGTQMGLPVPREKGPKRPFFTRCWSAADRRYERLLRNEVLYYRYCKYMKLI